MTTAPAIVIYTLMTLTDPGSDSAYGGANNVGGMGMGTTHQSSSAGNIGRKKGKNKKKSSRNITTQKGNAGNRGYPGSYEDEDEEYWY